jgi:hypothetical protein
MINNVFCSRSMYMNYHFSLFIRQTDKGHRLYIFATNLLANNRKSFFDKEQEIAVIQVQIKIFFTLQFAKPFIRQYIITRQIEL